MRITFRHVFWFAVVCFSSIAAGLIIGTDKKVGLCFLLAPMITLMIFIAIGVLWELYKYGNEKI